MVKVQVLFDDRFDMNATYDIEGETVATYPEEPCKGCPHEWDFSDDAACRRCRHSQPLRRR